MAEDKSTVHPLSKIPKDAEIGHVSMNPAHGGIIIRWSYNIPTPKKNQRGWRDFDEVFEWENQEKAFARLKEIFDYKIKRFKEKHPKANPGHGGKKKASY